MPPNRRLAFALAISATFHGVLLAALAPTYLTRYTPPSSPVAVLEVQLGPMEGGVESISEPPLETSENTAPPADNMPTAEGLVPALPLPPSTQYIPSKDLDTRPQAAEPIIVPFPEGASLGRPKATVKLSLYISAGGMVERVEAENSDLPQAFVDSAITSFRSARMRPGIKNGQPVASKMRIEVEFAEGR